MRLKENKWESEDAERTRQRHIPEFHATEKKNSKIMLPDRIQAWCRDAFRETFGSSYAYRYRTSLTAWWYVKWTVLQNLLATDRDSYISL